MVASRVVSVRGARVRQEALGVGVGDVAQRVPMVAALEPDRRAALLRIVDAGVEGDLGERDGAVVQFASRRIRGEPLGDHRRPFLHLEPLARPSNRRAARRERSAAKNAAYGANGYAGSVWARTRSGSSAGAPGTTAVTNARSTRSTNPSSSSNACGYALTSTRRGVQAAARPAAMRPSWRRAWRRGMVCMRVSVCDAHTMGWAPQGPAKWSAAIVKR